jgi:hypothetical protein
MDGASSAKYDVVSILALFIVVFCNSKVLKNEIQSTREKVKG